MFFCRYRVSWTSRYNRYNIFRCSILKNLCLPFNRQPSSRIRRWYTLLTFCGCCMTFFVRFDILLRFIKRVACFNFLVYSDKLNFYYILLFFCLFLHKILIVKNQILSNQRILVKILQKKKNI